MNRFRKKSDAKRAVQAVDALREAQAARVSQQQHQQSSLPPLPPASDFRTSLILPDLTRRFSVLRNSAGEPIGLDELKSRLAEHRAKGSEHRVSEEEEDMILEALGRLRGTSRSKATAVDDSTSDERLSTAFSDNQEGGSRTSVAPSLAGGQSVRSNFTATTTSSGLHGSPSIASLTSSTKGSQASRRMSNNLFSSGKFHDHAYVRTAHRRGGPARTGPVKHVDSNTSMSTVTSSRAGVGNSTSMYSDTQSLRPVTPDGSAYASSVPSSPSKPAMNRDGGSSEVLPGALSPEVLGRASLALDKVIRELEEEGDDEIVMERSPITTVPPPIHTANAKNMSYTGSMGRPPPDTSPVSSSPTSPTDEPGMALSSDEPATPSHESHRSSASPFPRASNSSPGPRLPGYIPGMPRPMTPRDTSFDADDLTPSATPRATSPRLPTGSSAAQPAPLIANIYRSNSSASTSRGSAAPALPPVSTSPLFFSRSTNGRHTPEDRGRGNNGSNAGSTSPTPQDPLESPTYTRRRPTSPLSAPAYQAPPITAVASSSSRPGTPSNVTWLSPSSPDNRGHVRNGYGSTSTTSGRSRSGSTASLSDPVASSYETDRSTLGINGSGRSNASATPTRTLRSPDNSDAASTWYDNRQASTTSLNGASDFRSPSVMSSAIDPGSPTRPYRSATPNQSMHNVAASPVSATFTDQSGYTNGTSLSPSRRTSRQNGHSSFSLSPGHALLLSPMGNSSRSSLVSEGSSYHSWDEDHKKDRLGELFIHLDPSFTEWHDLSGQASTSQTTPDGSPEVAEEVVRKQIGLTKTDVLSVQDKLVSAALTKAATPEGRNRANSVRRRRPSTSQSNYSFNGVENRVASPAPQPQAQPAPSRQANIDQIAKVGHSALLDSVVDSIQSPRSKAVNILPDDDAPPAVQPASDPEASSPGQRHRALADALFGSEDPEFTVLPSPTTHSAHLLPDPPADNATEQKPPPTAASTVGQSNETSSQRPAAQEVVVAVTPTALASGHVEPSLLELEVQRRVEAATAALRKSPSVPKLDGGSSRRKISPNQISSPKLVSSSTSVDTIPLPAKSPSQPQTGAAPSTKLGSRFKRLKGTLRAKTPIPGNEELHPNSADVRTPNSAQTATYNPDLFAMKDQPGTMSAAESTRFKIPSPPMASPPASAGPGLKGFMSRFRKHRPGEAQTPLAAERPGTASRTPTTATPTTTSSVSTGSRVDLPLSRSSTDSQTRSAPAAQAQFAALRPLSPQSPLSQSFADAIPEDSVAPTISPFAQPDEGALRQLYDAAANLGLDQNALQALVARSPSTTSRTTTWSKLTRNNSVAASQKTQLADTRDSRPPQSPFLAEGRTSMDAISPRPSTEIRQLTIRKHAEPSSASRALPQANTDPLRKVVRRTIIVPSDSHTSAVDFASLIRKQTTSQRRRSAGAGSITSNRSLQDRAPTPPPPRASSSGRRFSTDRSPPVPQLPQALSAHASAILAPAPVEKSGSTYDSLYDMYAGDSRGTSAAVPDGMVAGTSQQGEALPEPGQALEVIELANGETIWSIVNGLRDDDAESLYDNRTSFASDYSGEGVKLFFKEHGRKSSKSSNASLLSRKKQQPASSASQRPETKVFFSSSGQIARLIESMSRDVDAGSFNITPERIHGHAGHSASSSVGSAADMRWTLEERLEQMLGVVSPNP